jgi:4-hydroxy-4-methyl-2-oxoglutarate aldolase
MFSSRKEELSINVSITCGGVVVRPGDFVIADEIGVTVVPRDKAGEVLKLARDPLQVLGPVLHRRGVIGSGC